jgi:PKD repeat protein
MGAGVVVLLLAVCCGSAGAITVMITAPTAVAEYDWKIDAEVGFACDVGDLPGPGHVEYMWEFGDNEESEEETPDHTYIHTDTYTVTVTATFTPEGEGEQEEDDDSFTIYVIGSDVEFDAGTTDVRSYGGEPVPEDYMANCSIEGQPTGTQITWSVSGKLEVVTGQGTTDVSVRGKGASGAHNDQWITCTCSKGTVSYEDTDEDYESLEPYSAPVDEPDYPEDSAYLGGYWTLYVMILKDQWGAPMDECPVNEDFDDWIRDWDPNDWTTNEGGSLGTTGVDGDFDDNYIHWGHSDPTPQTPQDPLGTTAIHHVKQYYFAGSNTAGHGCQVKLHVLQCYRDHARQ